MNEEQFKKFIHPGYGALYAAGVVAALALAIAIVIWNTGSPVIVLLIGFGIAALILYSWFSLCKDYNRFLSLHKEKGDLDQIVQDFSNAKSWFKDQIRTGKEHLYCRRTLNYMIPYLRILNLYEQVHSTNGAEDRRNLIAVLEDGKKEDISTLPLRGTGTPELSDFYAFIAQKNPRITFGFNEAKR